MTSKKPTCTGKEFTPGTCGVVWRGANLKRIGFCPLHAAAHDLLIAAKRVMESELVKSQYANYSEALDALRFAIDRAGGR